jgi:Flp pilus assembly protein TadG
MKSNSLRVLSRRFGAARRGSASVEFAMSGIALFAFLMGIINLGDLGLTLGVLQRGVETAARQAAVTAASNLSASPATSCPTAANVVTYFTNAESPPLSMANVTLSSANGALPSNNAWTNNASPPGSATSLPGSYIVLTAKYAWKPLGFAALGPSINLSLTSIAFVMGTSATVTCSD